MWYLPLSNVSEHTKVDKITNEQTKQIKLILVLNVI